MYGKNYNWSNFRYLYQHKASDDAMVMQSMLAVSASELHRLGTGNSLVKSKDVQDPGLRYYGLALQKLFVALGELKTSKFNLESIISALYLLITYESRFGSSVSNLKLHIEGARSYLESYLQDQLNTGALQGNSPDSTEMTPFCAQLLLWMA